MTTDAQELVRAHHAALSALQELIRGWSVERTPSEVCAQIDAVIAAADGSEQARSFAYTYVFAARVGGQAADPERAVTWLRGWSASSRRTASEVHEALVDGVRFAQRLHRALGIPEPS
jgi:hypothetical protein